MSSHFFIAVGEGDDMDEVIDNIGLAYRLGKVYHVRGDARHEEMLADARQAIMQQMLDEELITQVPGLNGQICYRQTTHGRRSKKARFN